MNMPGFTAGASLYRSRNTYRGATVESSASLPADSIVLAQRDLNPENSDDCIQCNLTCFEAYVVCLAAAGGLGSLLCIPAGWACSAACKRVGGPCCPQDCGDYCCYRGDHCSDYGCCPAESAVCGGRCCGKDSYCCGSEGSECCYYYPPFGGGTGEAPPTPPGCAPGQEFCGWLTKNWLGGTSDIACCPPGMECCHLAVPTYYGRPRRDPATGILVQGEVIPGTPPDCKPRGFCIR
jgi:hypothetical protein